MKALILAGGFATRLRPISCTRPKILLPILNKPLLQWIFEKLAKNDVTEAIMAVNYQTECHLKQRRITVHGMAVKYSRDPLKKPLGTGGPIKRAEKLIGYDSSFLVLNGDIFTDIDYKKIFEKHREKEATATIALHKVEDPSRYGVAVLAKDNRIIKFEEKPPREKAPTNLANAGVYVLSPKIFQYIPKGRKVSLEREIFPKLAEEGTLYGYVFEGLWTDIGKPEEYLQLHKTLLESYREKQNYKRIHSVEIKKPVAIDEKVSIGKNSVIGPFAILGRNVVVGKNARLQHTVVFEDAFIGDNSSIEGAIIGEGANIGQKAKIEKGCIIGDFARIHANVSLTKNVLVCPAKEVHESVAEAKCLI